MSGLTTPRGPLPPAVYWRRRMAFLGMMSLLVIGVGSTLSQLTDGKDKPTKDAELSAGSPSPTASDATSQAPPQRPTRKSAPDVLPSSSGPCDPGDVKVIPVLKQRVAGQPIEIVLQLTTGVTVACDWQVSADELSVKVTSGADSIWSTADCPRVVTEQDVVLRRDSITRVRLTWNGKRSGERCTRGTEWALPGFYHLAVAALGGEPTDIQFELTEPEPEVITRTVTPSPEKPNDKPTRKPKGGASNAG